jgi:hypothetical protein
VVAYLYYRHPPHARVDLPEALLEVFSWTGADQAFTSVTVGEARLKDLHVTIAAAAGRTQLQRRLYPPSSGPRMH